MQDARAGFKGGGLARAVMADEAVDLAGLDMERQIVHGLLILAVVLLGQVFDSEHIDLLPSSWRYHITLRPGFQSNLLQIYIFGAQLTGGA